MSDFDLLALAFVAPFAAALFWIRAQKAWDELMFTLDQRREQAKLTSVPLSVPLDELDQGVGECSGEEFDPDYWLTTVGLERWLNMPSAPNPRRIT